jgi:Fe-S cluster assembly protein SufD
MAETVQQVMDSYLSYFEALEKSLNGAASTELHTIRKAAIDRFIQLGFPNRRDEEWKYTDVSPIAKLSFKPVFQQEAEQITIADIDRLPLGNLRCSRLVFINGHFSPKLSTVNSLPKGVKIESLAHAISDDGLRVKEHLLKYARYEENAFNALNAAFLQDGAFVYLPAGTVLEEPIHLLFLSTATGSDTVYQVDSREASGFVSHPRNLILIEKNSELKVIESYAHLHSGRYFTNVVTEIVVGENSVLEHEKVQLEDERAFHVGTTQVRQERNSTFVSNSISLGGALVRNNLTSVLDGEGAQGLFNGLYVTREYQHVDNHTVFDHVKPHCSSRELYKGILGGRSRGVFNGKIIVRKDAQKTDAKQTNKNLILSEEASIDTKPQLEIFANDVKCTHGATIGQLDDDAIFYLRSRGIELENARAREAIDGITIEPLKEDLQRLVHARITDFGNRESTR